MSREYVVGGSNLTVANAAVSLVAIMPLAGQTIRILRCGISQHANATSAQQRVSIGVKGTAYQTVVTATPQKTKQSDPASGITGVAGSIAAGKCGINASAEGAGTYTELWGEAFNVLNGYLWIPTPDEVIEVNGTSVLAFTLQFPAAPTTLTGWNAFVVFKELG
jgi:hypothetical protein